MNEQDKLIIEQLQTLPPNLQRAINTVPWRALTQEIGKANALDAEQIVSLEQETILIIYGFENPQDYIANLVREVGIDEIVATTIASAIGEKILKSIDTEANKEVAREKVMDGPIIITRETKEETLKELHRRTEWQQKISIPQPVSNIPVIPPANLPMVEEGEVAHEVPHVEQVAQSVPIPAPQKAEPKTTLPDYRYEGKDPYREPLK